MTFRLYDLTPRTVMAWGPLWPMPCSFSPPGADSWLPSSFRKPPYGFTGSASVSCRLQRAPQLFDGRRHAVQAQARRQGGSSRIRACKVPPWNSQSPWKPSCLAAGLPTLCVRLHSGRLFVSGQASWAPWVGGTYADDCRHRTRPWPVSLPLQL